MVGGLYEIGAPLGGVEGFNPLLLRDRSKPISLVHIIGRRGAYCLYTLTFFGPSSEGMDQGRDVDRGPSYPSRAPAYYPLAYHRGGLSGFASKMALGWVPRV